MAESTQRLSSYEQSQKRYQDLLGGSDKFKSMVEQQIKEKTNYNKDLLEQQQRLIEQQLSLPSQLRSEFSGGPIIDPLAQEALIQQRSSNVGQQLGSVGNLLTARGQRESDLLNTALQSYQTKLSAEQTAAENAWRLYQDALAREQASRGSGSGAGGFNIADLFNQAQNTETQPIQQNTYEIPTSTPRKANVSNVVQDVLAKSVLDYQNAPNAWQKYLQLQKGSLGSLASVPVAGLAGPVAYATSILPSVWGDIKGLFSKK